MNRGEMRSDLSFIVNVDEGTANQDFSTSRLNKAIQWCYDEEVRKAKLRGQVRWFKKTAQITWPASQVRLKLPTSLSKRNLVGLWDFTNADPGYPIVVRETSLDGGDCWWFDNDTLQWGTTGPSSAVTVHIEYLEDAEFLASDSNEPDLIPTDYHKMIVWGAAVFLRAVGDEAPPAFWVQQHSELQMDYWKFLSKGRPFTDGPSVQNNTVAAGLSFSEAAITPGSGGLNP